MQVDQALVDAHFVLVPGLSTVSGWCLTSNDAEDLGWKANRAGNAKVLLEGRLLKFSADLFQVLHVLGGQSDADTVELAGLRFQGLRFSKRGSHCISTGRRAVKKTMEERGKGSILQFMSTQYRDVTFV